MQAATNSQSPDGSLPTSPFSFTSSLAGWKRTSSDSSMTSNRSVPPASSPQQQPDQDKNNNVAVTSNSYCRHCNNSINNSNRSCGSSICSMRDRLSLAPTPDRRYSYNGVDIGFGTETCSMEERMQKEKNTNFYFNNAVSKATDNVRKHTTNRNSSTTMLSSTRLHRSSLTSTTQSVSAALRSVRFSSFPCRPLLSMQRNAEFNAVTAQSQEFNKGRSARNMFSEQRSGSVQNFMIDDMWKKRQKVSFSL